MIHGAGSLKNKDPVLKSTVNKSKRDKKAG